MTITDAGSYCEMFLAAFEEFLYVNHEQDLRVLAMFDVSEYSYFAHGREFAQTVHEVRYPPMNEQFSSLHKIDRSDLDAS